MVTAEGSGTAVYVPAWADSQERLLQELLAEHRKMNKRLDDVLQVSWPTARGGFSQVPVFSPEAVPGTVADLNYSPHTVSTVDASASGAAKAIHDVACGGSCSKGSTTCFLSSPSEAFPPASPPFVEGKQVQAVWFSLPTGLTMEKRRTGFNWGELNTEQRLEILVSSRAFHVLCSSVILANAVYMGFSVEFNMGRAVAHMSRSDQSSQSEDLSLSAEVFFCVFYCVELVLKLCCQKLRFFTGTGRIWNTVDLVLVLLGVLGLTGILSSVDLMFLRALRIFRNVTGTLRMFRLARFCTELRVMVQSIAVSLRSFLWCCFLLIILMYMCAVVFVDGIASHILSMPSSEIDEDVRVATNEHWGSLGRAMFTEYKSVTGGNPWGTVVDPLQAAGGFYFALFLLYIGGLVLAALKLFTGIFCQYAAAAIARDNEAEAEHLALSALARELDLDGSGTICGSELDELARLRPSGCLARMGVDPGDAGRVVRRLSAASSDGRISALDLVRGCRALRAPAKGVDIAKVASRVDEIAEALECRGLRAGGWGEKPASLGVSREAWPRA